MMITRLSNVRADVALGDLNPGDVVELRLGAGLYVRGEAGSAVNSIVEMTRLRDGAWIRQCRKEDRVYLVNGAYVESRV